MPLVPHPGIQSWLLLNVSAAEGRGHTGDARCVVRTHAHYAPVLSAGSRSQEACIRFAVPPSRAPSSAGSPSVKRTRRSELGEKLLARGRMSSWAWAAASIPVNAADFLCQLHKPDLQQVQMQGHYVQATVDPQTRPTRRIVHTLLGRGKLSYGVEQSTRTMTLDSIGSNLTNTQQGICLVKRHSEAMWGVKGVDRARFHEGPPKNPMGYDTKSRQAQAECQERATEEHCKK